MAWTLADLAGRERPGIDEVAVALAMRRGEQLSTETTEAGQLVARIGAQAAWTKIVEGLLGEPLARRAAATDLDAVQRLAERSGARFVVPGEEEWADSGTTWLDSAALAEGTPSCGDDA